MNVSNYATDSAIPMADFIGLIIALALGLLVGIQRGWVARSKEPGQRIAGIRTYALIGLLGGISALIGKLYGGLIIAVMFISLSGIITVAYYRGQQQTGDLSITSLIGALLTFCFGVMAGAGMWVLAASSAIFTTLILDNKDAVHGLLTKLQARELDAGLKLLLASVVMLSILPNKSYGPWEAINPYEIWWMVVLISSISFVGYFAVRIGGASRGLLFTSLFAGLSSSTALTLQYSKLAKRNPGLHSLLASGILIACGTMFPRMLFVSFLINQELAALILLPTVVMMVVMLAAAGVLLKMHNKPLAESIELKQNPLEFSSAFAFAGLLLVIIILSNLLREWFGASGTALLGVVSGVADVDPINLVLSRQAGVDISLREAGLGILIAAVTNTIVKGCLAWGVGGKGMGQRVLLPISFTIVCGFTTMHTFGFFNSL